MSENEYGKTNNGQDVQLDKLFFPPDLIDDFVDGKVVIFAGAGVSKNKPSDLPDFIELYKSVSETDKEPEDLFKAFEDLEDKDEGLKEKVCKKFEHQHNSPKELSQPNKNHEILSQLFPDASKLKIVTTNFDKHLSTAGGKVHGNKEIIEYTNPALPKGDNFSGIVYLHGSTDNPEDIVITETDIAQSYIKYARTTAFLREMFNHYTVLFIGHSHDDQILNLIAKSDNFPTGKRYIVTKSGNDKKWEKLNIEIIKPDKGVEIGHDDIWNSLKLLSGFLSKNLDIIKFVEEKAKLNPNELEAYEQQKLIYLLKRNSPQLEVFCNNAKHIEWLYWIDKAEILKTIFSDTAKQEEQNSISTISIWIVDNFIEKHPETCIKIINDLGINDIHSTFSSWIGWKISTLKNTESLKKLLPTLRTISKNLDNKNFLSYSYILESFYSNKEDREIFVNFLDILLEPKLVKENDTNVTISFCGEGNRILELWKDKIIDIQSEIWSSLFPLLISNLNKLDSLKGDKRLENEDGADIKYCMEYITKDILSFLIKEKKEIGLHYKEEWRKLPEKNIFHKIASCVSEDGKRLDENVVEITSGWVSHESDISFDEILKSKPIKLAKYLVPKNDKTNIATRKIRDDGNITYIDREGFLDELEKAISLDYKWSKELMNFIEKGKYWEISDLAESLIDGWKKSELSDEQWGEILETISKEEAIIEYCKYSVVNLIKERISSSNHSSIPKNLYKSSLDILYKSIFDFKENNNNNPDNIFDNNGRDWFHNAINSPTGSACEAMLNIISKSSSGWIKETLVENLDKYILPILSSNDKDHEICLPIIGRWSVFIFNMNKDWFVKNVEPIITSDDQYKRIKVWHGLVYTHEFNDIFYNYLHIYIEKAFKNVDFIKNFRKDDSNNNDSIVKGNFATMVALHMLRSLFCKKEKEIKKEWLGNVVENSDEYLLSRILWNIKDRLSQEPEVREKSLKVWSNILQPIFEKIKDKKTLPSLKEIALMVEIIPYLTNNIAFKESIEFLKTNFNLFKVKKENKGDSYLDLRVYSSLQNFKCCENNSEESFGFIEYLLKSDYKKSENYEIKDVFNCLDILHTNGIEKSRIKDLVEKYLCKDNPVESSQF